MAATESVRKQCIVCGKDVAGKPRVKDELGQYMCAGECEKRAAQARKSSGQREDTPAPPPVVKQAVKPEPPVATFMSNLIEQSPMLKATKCESCGSPMSGAAVLCTRCGFNTQTGKALRTAVIREREEKAPKVQGGKYQNKYATSGVGTAFWKMLLVETLVFSGVACLPLLGNDAFLASWLILMVAGFVAWIASIVAAFKNDQTAWGICGICMLVPIVGMFASLGFLVYSLLFNEDKLSRALFLSTLIAYVVWFAVIVISIYSGEKFEFFGRPIGG